MTPFVKPLSAIDQLFVAFQNVRPPCINQLVVEGSGALESDELQSALDLATSSNPGCALRLFQGPALTWVPGPSPRLTSIDAPDWSGRDSNNAPFLLSPLDLHHGPSCEVMFVRSRETIRLVFRSLHAVMDGVGTICWAKEVFRALRNEPLLEHLSTLTSDDLELEEAPTVQLPAPDALHPFGRVNEGSSSNGYAWKRISIARPMTPGMLPRLVARLGLQARSVQPGTVRIHIPADLRAYRPKERSTGNLSGSLWIEPGPSSSAEGLGLELIRMLYERRALAPLDLLRWVRQLPFLLTQMSIAAAFATEHQSGRYRATATLSHLGQVTSREFSAPNLTATSCYFVPVFTDWACYVVLNGFDQQVEACVALPDPFTKRGELAELASLVESALDSD